MIKQLPFVACQVILKPTNQAVAHFEEELNLVRC